MGRNVSKTRATSAEFALAIMEARTQFSHKIIQTSLVV